MNYSDTINWVAAILLSLLAHSMMFVQSGAQIDIENTAKLQSPLITRLNFNRSVVTPEQDKPVLVKKPSQKKVKPSPVKKKIIQKRRSVKSVEPVRQSESAAEPESVPQQISVPQQEQQVSHNSESLLREKRQQYLFKLLSHIESFKYYPRAARRRAIEGEMNISFILQDDGSYQQLVIDGDHNVLVKATRQALESSLPLPSPPGDIGLSREIAFTMVYSLTN